MAEFLSRDEIDMLLDIAEQGESINLDFENIKTVKYDIDTKTFYKHHEGYETEDEAKFRSVKERLTMFNNNIIEYKNYIEQYQKIIEIDIVRIDKLLNEYSDSLIQFAEEMLI